MESSSKSTSALRNDEPLRSTSQLIAHDQLGPQLERTLNFGGGLPIDIISWIRTRPWWTTISLTVHGPVHPRFTYLVVLNFSLGLLGVSYNFKTEFIAA
ncbi:hypothetical protein JTE90_023492 [Oedothorax gibbosus]|uniref:Uncharacterized protein n=1 Tax=Oedothorax gibbosus TaxID=931172 RepID=A0AAV6VQ45_9ARAC|nr:hypothetical protein JTE90_023492 [Oedothorax gibbosus]